ncbi:cytochrome P450 [Streptomyces sp. ISID311]|uniref:cytochrome P450 n=1 Tax=Streptomyces sp. ISID311 TaxID=2601673 RepID=UPI0011BD3FDF|nr:cytochrome P450 [Streptomyces sp. ISID311]TXC99819.1 cytochrome P450 [Streptomyces sp. ISID311]
MNTPVPYPFNTAEGLDLADAYRVAQRTPGLLRVQLPYGEPAWLVTRRHEARAVLADARFSRADAARDAPRTTPVSPIGLVATDPPDHTRLRRLATRAFTARRAEALRPRVREITEDAIRRMTAEKAPADLVEHVALPVPIMVICELLGVPVEDRDRFRGWSDMILSTSGTTPRDFMAATAALKAYMGELIERRQAEPADDLMTALLRARDEETPDNRASRDELVELCIAILLGGYETTASQFANFTWLLLTERPDALAELADRPERARAWVEELLRYVPLAASASLPRYALENVEVGGAKVRAGEPVLVAIGAANRDALRFPRPDDLDPDLDTSAHLAFGHGIHHCAGAALARVELQEGLTALARLLPGLRPAGDATWKSAAFLRGPTTLPVSW